MRIRDWSSDVCSSDLGLAIVAPKVGRRQHAGEQHWQARVGELRQHGIEVVVGGIRIEAAQAVVGAQFQDNRVGIVGQRPVEPRQPAGGGVTGRSEEHTSELQSLMRISYAVFCLKKKTK